MPEPVGRDLHLDRRAVLMRRHERRRPSASRRRPGRRPRRSSIELICTAPRVVVARRRGRGGRHHLEVELAAVADVLEPDDERVDATRLTVEQSTIVVAVGCRSRSRDATRATNRMNARRIKLPTVECIEVTRRTTRRGRFDRSRAANTPRCLGLLNPGREQDRSYLWADRGRSGCRCRSRGRCARFPGSAQTSASVASGRRNAVTVVWPLAPWPLTGSTTSWSANLRIGRPRTRRADAQRAALDDARRQHPRLGRRARRGLERRRDRRDARADLAAIVAACSYHAWIGTRWPWRGPRSHRR